MLQGGAQFFIEVLCILKARFFANPGNNILSFDCCNQIKFLHIIAIATLFSVVKFQAPASICNSLGILRTSLCLYKCNFSLNISALL